MPIAIPGDDNRAIQPGVATVSVPKKGSGLQGAFNDINQYINPPPDPRLNDIVARKAPGLRHGIIQQTDDMVGPDQKFPYACRFLFNPAVINVSYNVATGVTPPSELTPDQAKALAIYPGATGIGFSLLFDRTYDVYYGPQAGGFDLREIGVYADIAALESVTGVRTNVTVAGNDNITLASGDNSSAIVGNMLMIPAYVIFGGGNGGKSGKPLTGLTYIGYITSMNVSYGLFSENMVPTRAAVDIQMTQLVGKDAVSFQAAGGTLVDRGAKAFPTTNRDSRNRTNTATVASRSHRRRR